MTKEPTPADEGISIDWDRIGNCLLEKNDETLVFCLCGCRPYCPCHQQLPNERDGLCGKGRHPFYELSSDEFIRWHDWKLGRGPKPTGRHHTHLESLASKESEWRGMIAWIETQAEIYSRKAAEARADGEGGWANSWSWYSSGLTTAAKKLREIDSHSSESSEGSVEIVNVGLNLNDHIFVNGLYCINCGKHLITDFLGYKHADIPRCTSPVKESA